MMFCTKTRYCSAAEKINLPEYAMYPAHVTANNDVVKLQAINTDHISNSLSAAEYQNTLSENAPVLWSFPNKHCILIQLSEGGKNAQNHSY